MKIAIQACACLALGLLSACAPARATPGAAPTATIALNFAPTPLPTEMECVMVISQATPEATEAPLYPDPAPQDWSQGPQDAAVTFLEYTDLQAAASPALDLNLARLAAKYPADVRRVFRHFPLPGNDKAMAAAAAAEAAGRQGRFFEMADLLAGRQAEWAALDAEGFRAWLLEQAAALGLDAERFSTALDDPAVAQKLAAAQQFGLQAAIPTMPWLLINGKIYQGPRDFRSLESVVRLLMLEKKQFKACPPMVIDPQKRYYARLQTAKGEILAELYAAQAPLAVNNFVFLAREGWYDGVTFHTVIPGYIAQSGDPSGSGFGTPGYAFADDVNNLRFDQPGMLAMASAGPDSNGSQFFINFQADSRLNGRYVIFGKVIEGLDVLSRLTPRDPSSPADLPEGDVIEKVVIEERGSN